MTTIEMKNIVKKYGAGFAAVNDVSIDVKDGEFMILVGPSGCGKSTLLRMIVGLEDITEGEMMIGDRLVNDLAPRDRNLSMVFQNYALYPHLSVYENIAFPLRLAKASDEEVDKKVREGEYAEFWVDGTKIHLFDPSSGANLTVDPDNAGRIPVQAD